MMEVMESQRENVTVTAHIWHKIHQCTEKLAFTGYRNKV